MLSVKAICRTVAGAGALSLAIGAMSGAQAQTAQDYNRAAAAMQLCGSPAGAAIPQCAQLNQQLGVGGGAAAGANASAGAAAAGALLNGLANRGGGGGGLAGLLGGLANQAAQASTPAPAAPPPGSADYYNQATAATYNAAAGYQACVAANPANWQACLAQMNGGVPVAIPGAPAQNVALNLTGAALAGYQRCLQTNPADKCAQAYGASATAAAAPGAGAANTVANAAAMAQTAKQLAPTLKALGSLLGR